MALGDRIREARNEKALSQAGLGAKLGISREAVAQWESGETSPTLDKFEALARALGVAGEWLLTGQGPKTMLNLTRSEDHALHLARFLPGAELEKWLENGQARLHQERPD